MRFLIDENMSSPVLASRLRVQGHDPVLASDVGLLSVTDARVLIYAISQALPVLTQDSEQNDLNTITLSYTFFPLRLRPPPQGAGADGAAGERKT